MSAARDFIRQRFELRPLPFRPDISLYQPTPKSGLVGFLAAQGSADAAPYWAYAWAGGAALAVHLLAHRELVASRSVLDFGAGSGLVAIAAARAGATVTAFEPDPIGRTAIALNAEANGIELAIADAPIDAEIVLAGDVFYDAAVAARTLPVLLDLASRGAEVIVGDPFRRDLPLAHLELFAEYHVPDIGSAESVRAGVFALHS